MSIETIGTGGIPRRLARALARLAAVSAILAAGFAAAGTAQGAVRGRLKVSENRHYLQYEDGTPFFYLGDTAWELFHRLNREEADRYLENRARKGFTVIQAVVLAQIGGLTEPNAYGDVPLAGRDPAQPNEAYFRHVDYVVNKAEALGLFVGMLPTWGSYWNLTPGNKGSIFTVENARVYGRYLGRRYKDKPIIWILGGDRTITREEERAVMDAMAAGLEEGDGKTHLKTFHPSGPGLSSNHLHDSAWLDFNMYQSSHGAQDHDNGLYAEHDYALQPPKPTLDGEPRYEQMPVGFYFQNYSRQVRFDDYDARQAAYWSLFAGACGHTYGNNNIWPMWQPGRGPAIFSDIPWYEALDHPGAFQMTFVRRLFESRPFLTLEPYPSMVKAGPAAAGAKVRAVRAANGSFAFVYSPRGESFTVDKNAIKARRVKEIWYDPKYGVARQIHSTDNWGFQTYTPPTSGRGNDWILILEDEAAKFPLPGTAPQAAAVR